MGLERKALLLIAFMAAVAATGMAAYERQLFQLRAELEEARLREAKAVASRQRSCGGEAAALGT